MSGLDDRYRPPGGSLASEHVPSSGARSRFVLKVFLSWVLGGSVVLGMVECLSAGYALSLSMPQWAAGVVALGALRLNGAGVALSAAAIALVLAVHRRPALGASLRRAPVFRVALLSLPPAALGAACLATAVALGTAHFVFDVPFHASWTHVRKVVSVEDPLVGAALASIFAMLLAGAAPLAGRLLVRMPRRLLLKIVLALVVTQVTTAMVNAAVTLVLSGADPTSQDGGMDLPEVSVPAPS